MCGIVGYIGFNQASDFLLDGMAKLEYRGYDSAGIAVIGPENAIKIQKKVGRLANLEAIVKADPNEGTVGIGHTRWATHGRPSDMNAHPHASEDGKFAVVHNGIIENYMPLKEELIEKGYHFKSETDTEVVAHLVDKYYEGNLLDAVYKATERLRGAYALGVICKDNNNELVAVRKDSPLVVGLGEGENFIASDIPAILKYTRNVYFLENGEFVHIVGDKLTILDENRNVVEKEVTEITWDVEAASKGGYEHFMLKEIYEQPNGVKETLIRRLNDNGEIQLDDIKMTKEDLDKINKVYIVACGTAYHAGLVGKFAIEKFAKIPVITDIASEFRYRDPFVDENTLLILVSQSGETADTKAALHLAHDKGAKVLSVVNVKGSSIARESDMVLYTHAGPEISVASTKAFSVQMSVMYLLAFEMAYAKGHIDENECKRLTAKLAEIPDIIEKTMECEKKCKYVSSKLITAQSLLYIGRGLDYALSMEGSLKLKEISYIHSESYAAGELKHGTISLVEDGMPVIGVATQTELLEKTVSNIVEVKSRGAFTIAVCKEGTEFSEGVIDEAIEVPAMEDVLMPMLTVIPLQLIAYYTTVLKGLNVDKPRNLAKSVTVE